MRPFVEKGQGVPRIGARLAHPRTRAGIRLLHGALKIASAPALRNLAARVAGAPTKSPDPSRYDALEADPT